MQQIQFSFPPFQGLTKKIVLGLFGIFIAQLLLEVWAGIQVTSILALDPTSIGLQTSWQLFTHILVHPPQAIFQLLMNLLMIWWFVSPIEQTHRAKGVWRLCLLSALCSSIPSLLFGLATSKLDLFSFSYLAGSEPIVLASLAVFAFRYGNSHIHLFGVFPIRAIQIIYFSIALAGLIFLASRNLTGLVGHLGAIGGGWLFMRWKPKTPKKKIPKKGFHSALEILEGGKGRDDRWLN